MNEAFALILGIAIGTIGALLPMGVLYRGRGFFSTSAQGLLIEGTLAIFVSLVFMAGSLYVCVMYETLSVITPVCAVLTFLFVWSLMALRLHKSRGRMHGRRKGN